MSITASSADLPRHGAPAACAVWPRNLKIAETIACDPERPQPTPSSFPTCVKSVTSTSLKMPARTRCAFPASCSSATPGHRTSVPGIFSRSMISFTTSAAAMFTACPELCPSPCPGAPASIGSR